MIVLCGFFVAAELGSCFLLLLLLLLSGIM